MNALAYRTFTPLLMLMLAMASFFPSVAVAQNSYPPYQEKYVNDFADIIRPEDENQIRTLFADLEDQTEIEATVLTINSISDYNTGDTTIESFATGLYNTWGIGKLPENEGLLILVAIEDRTMRIELGDGFKNEYNGTAQRVIDDEMVPLFRDGEFSRGILNGSRAAMNQIAGRRLQARADSDQASDQASGQAVVAPTATPRPTATHQTTTGQTTDARPQVFSEGPPNPVDVVTGGLIVAVLGALGIGGAGVVGFNLLGRRKKPRPCPNCSETMIRLDEASDDMYLDSGQRAEEYLKSVDYDVWVCQQCNAKSVYPYRAWFSGYSVCHQCRHRTLEKTSTVTDRPTTSSTGRKEIFEECRHCDYTHTETVILPRVEENNNDSWSSSSSSSSSWSSSSSSSSSFGGGSSSGGGGSGSW